MVLGGSAQAPAGCVGLFLTDSWRSLEVAPARVPLGSVHLHAWHIYAVPPSSALHPGTAGYLVKLGYDLQVLPDVPGPAWFDISFEFGLADAVVVAAIPRAPGDGERGPFRLSAHYEFLPHDETRAMGGGVGDLFPGVGLPASSATVELTRAGGSTVSWRHTPGADAPLRAGVHTAWVALLTNARRRRLPVTVTVTFDVLSPPASGLVPDARPEAFTITLPREAPAPAMTGTEPAGVGRADAAARRVFVSYAHESPEHKRAVDRFCGVLRDCGVNVHLDEWAAEEGARLNWHRWVTTQIENADYVVVVASPAYRSAGTYRLPADSHRGIQAEYSVLADHLHGDRSTWTRKILPVVLPGRRAEEIPPFFEPHNADHYLVPTLDQDGVAGVLRAINARPPGKG